MHHPPESAYFLAANRNKRSITVNFKHPSGLEIMRRLIRRADVMVENYIPGKLYACSWSSRLPLNLPQGQNGPWLEGLSQAQPKADLRVYHRIWSNWAI
jgi:hypothetical protein